MTNNFNIFKQGVAVRCICLDHKNAKHISRIVDGQQITIITKCVKKLQNPSLLFIKGILLFLHQVYGYLLFVGI